MAVDKRHQRANWGERPIKAAMLEYARMDTHYLIPLRELRAAELEEAGLWELAQEDFKRLTESNGALPGRPDCWSVAGREILEPQQLAVLQGIIEYRERFASQVDRPCLQGTRRSGPGRSGKSHAKKPDYIIGKRDLV